MPDYIKITGKVIGEPELYSYVRSCEIVFSLELADEIPDINKKSGDIIVVHYSSSYITFIREGDQVEFLGRIKNRHLKHKDVMVSWIEAHQLYNQTLEFSFDY